MSVCGRDSFAGIFFLRALVNRRYEFDDSARRGYPALERGSFAPDNASASVAQWIERVPSKHQVGSSILSGGASVS